MSIGTGDATASGVEYRPPSATIEHPSTRVTGKRQRRGPRAWRLAFTALAAIMLSAAGLATMPFGTAHAAAPELSVTKCKGYGGSGQAGTLGDALAQAARTSGSAITFACDGVGPFMILVPAKIAVGNTLTISSPARNVILDGARSTRLFEVQSTGNLTLEGITVAHGKDRVGGGAYIWGPGKLTIKDSIFSDNSVQNVSGDLGNPTGVNSYGGGVFNDRGTLTIIGSTFSNNAATGANGSFPYPLGGDGYGGAVYSRSGTLTIDHSTFRANRASGGVPYVGARRPGYGGAVYSSSGALTIANSAFSGNWAVDGGGVYNNGGALTITGATISGNTAGSRGGGVSNTGGAATLTITNTTISGNQSGVYGGGVSNDDGTVSITNSGLLANFAGGDGEFSGFGGGIYSAGAKRSAMVTIANSTLSGNWAFGESGTWHGYGGGIFSGSNTRLSVTNSTFSDNVVGVSKTVQIADPYVRAAVSAATQILFHVDLGGFLASHNYTSVGSGAGVYNDGVATITNSTFSGNQAVGGGSSGGGVNTTGPMTIKNSIMAGNTANASGAANCGGFVTDGGYNLMNTVGECNSTPGKHDVWTSDPKLGGLADNGGPTLTLALLKDSLAIDQIPRGTNGCGTDLTTDQRGLTRPQGEKCDIGTFELDNVAPTTTASIAPKPNANGVYTADVKVTLSGGNDASGSGVKATYYKLDNGGQQTYTAPLSITSEGQHTLTYWSVDKQGNEEIARVLTFTLDKTPATPPIPPIVYIGAGLAAILIIALIVVLLIRRRKPGAGAGAAAEIGEPSAERPPAGVR